jgi:hypothetical protein
VAAIAVLEEGAAAAGLAVPRGIAGAAAREAAEAATLRARAVPAGA